MAQVEHVIEMKVGDFIQLPAGEWHKNAAAQAIYAEAQQRMRDAQGTEIVPQYQIENEPGPGFKAKLVRIR